MNNKINSWDSNNTKWMMKYNGPGDGCNYYGVADFGIFHNSTKQFNNNQFDNILEIVCIRESSISLHTINGDIITQYNSSGDKDSPQYLEHGGPPVISDFDNGLFLHYSHLITF